MWLPRSRSVSENLLLGTMEMFLNLIQFFLHYIAQKKNKFHQTCPFDLPMTKTRLCASYVTSLAFNVHLGSPKKALFYCIPNCTLVCKLAGSTSCIAEMSAITSLKVLTTSPATKLRFHSPLSFQTQSIRPVLICSSCSTVQPLERFVRSLCSCSIQA